MSDNISTIGTSTSTWHSELTSSRANGLSNFSCRLCQLKKVKCDRNLPCCSRCVRLDRRCTYTNKTAPGTRIRELENRVENLECSLQIIGRRLEHSNLVLKSQAFPTSIPEKDSNNASLIVRDAENEQLSGIKWPDIPYIQRLPPDSTKPDFHLEAEASSGPAHSLGLKVVSIPYHLQLSVADLYFKHINPWCPILDRRKSWEILFGSTDSGGSSKALLYAVVASALRFTDDPRLTHPIRTHIQSVAKEYVFFRNMSSPDLITLQALLILTLESLGDWGSLSTATALTVVARIAIRLGFGLDHRFYNASSKFSTSSMDQNIITIKSTNWIEEEERRRLLWMTYIIDRYEGVAEGTEFIIRDEDMRTQLPCRYDLFANDLPVKTKLLRPNQSIGQSPAVTQNLGSFSYHCEIMTLFTKAQQLVHTTIDIESQIEVLKWHRSYWELDAELNAWLSNLPSEHNDISQLCHTDPTSKISNWITLQGAIVTCIIRLQSPMAYPITTSEIFFPSEEARKHCLTAAVSLKRIVQDVAATNMLSLLGPPFAFALWTSARLLLVHASTGKESLDTSIEIYISALESMGKFWQAAETYARILRHICQRLRIDEREEQNGCTSSSILAAMRKRVYETMSTRWLRDQPRCSTVIAQEISGDLRHEIQVFDFFSFPCLPKRLPSGSCWPADTIDCEGLFKTFK